MQLALSIHVTGVLPIAEVAARRTILDVGPLEPGRHSARVLPDQGEVREGGRLVRQVPPPPLGRGLQEQVRGGKGAQAG